MGQCQRANNNEIKGAPPDGDPTAFVKEISELVGEPITGVDVRIWHRVPTQKQTKKNKHNCTLRTTQQKKRADGKTQKRNAWSLQILVLRDGKLQSM